MQTQLFFQGIPSESVARTALAPTRELVLALREDGYRAYHLGEKAAAFKVIVQNVEAEAEVISVAEAMGYKPMFKRMMALGDVVATVLPELIEEMRKNPSKVMRAIAIFDNESARA